MENEIYIASSMGRKIEQLPASQRAHVRNAINSLNGDGWRNSQIVVPDNSAGGGLRSSMVEGIRLFFRPVPENHAIIVVDAATVVETELAAAGS